MHKSPEIFDPPPLLIAEMKTWGVGYKEGPSKENFQKPYDKNAINMENPFSKFDQKRHGPSPRFSNCEPLCHNETAKHKFGVSFSYQKKISIEDKKKLDSIVFRF